MFCLWLTELVAEPSAAAASSWSSDRALGSGTLRSPGPRWPNTWNCNIVQWRMKAGLSLCQIQLKNKCYGHNCFLKSQGLQQWTWTESGESCWQVQLWSYVLPLTSSLSSPHPSRECPYYGRSQFLVILMPFKPGLCLMQEMFYERIRGLKCFFFFPNLWIIVRKFYTVSSFVISMLCV